MTAATQHKGVNLEISRGRLVRYYVRHTWYQGLISLTNQNTSCSSLSFGGPGPNSWPASTRLVKKPSACKYCRTSFTSCLSYTDLSLQRISDYSRDMVVVSSHCRVNGRTWETPGLNKTIPLTARTAASQTSLIFLPTILIHRLGKIIAFEPSESVMATAQGLIYAAETSTIDV